MGLPGELHGPLPDGARHRSRHDGEPDLPSGRGRRSGEILGFYGFEPESEGIGLSHFFVAPAAIGRGVGRALWADAVARAKLLRQRRMIVVSDPNAAGFYARMGARPAGCQALGNRSLPAHCRYFASTSAEPLAKEARTMARTVPSISSTTSSPAPPRPGADAADAVLVQGASLSVAERLGRPEKLERAEGRDLGLRVFIGKRQAIVSSTDFSPDGARSSWPARAVAMARVVPEDPFCGLADAGRDRQEPSPALDLCDPDEPTAEQLTARLREAEDAARGVAGVTNSEGAEAGWSRSEIALAASNGFRNGYAASHSGISVSVLAGEGTGMERDYDFTSAVYGADSGIRCRRRPAGRREGGAASQSAQGRHGQGARRSSIPAFPTASSAIWPARSTVPESRAASASSRTSWASRCCPTVSTSSTIPIAGAACAPSPSTARVWPMPGACWWRTAS